MRSLRLRALFAVLCSLSIAACASSPVAQQPNSLAEVKDTAKVSQHLADAARQEGDYAGAVELYRKMLAAGGDPFQAHLGLGDSLLASAALDDSEKEYQAAAVIAPGRPEPRLGLGRALLAKHRPAEALGAFDQALKNGADGAVALNGKGLALDYLGRHADAQLAYQEGLKVAPQDRVLRSNYGLSLALSGNYEPALALLMPIAQDAAATPRNRQNLALVLGLKGDPAAARAVALHDLSADAVDSNLQFYQAARLASAGTAGAAAAH